MSFKERRRARHEKKEKKAEAKRAQAEHWGTRSEQYANLWFAYKFIFHANKKLFVVRIPLLIIQTIQNIVPIFLVRAIINEITESKRIERVVILAAVMAGTMFTLGIISKRLTIWDSREREKLNFNVKRILAEKTMEMSYETIENPEMEDYVWLAQNNKFDMILQVTTGFFGALLNVLGIGAAVLSLNPLILAVILASCVVKFLVDRKQRDLPHEYNNVRIRFMRKNNYYMSLMDDISVGKEVRVNNLEDWVTEKSESSWKDDLFPLDKNFTQKTLVFQQINNIISMVQNILIYLILAMEVIGSTMTIGDFSMYLTAAGTFSDSIIGISWSYSNLLIQSAWYLKEYRHCLDIAKKAQDEGGHTHIEIGENAEIEFRDVSFKYPSTDRMILEHINIIIKRGEALSIVGVNGAGKTTFVKLLCRLYEPTSGEILVNGIPAKEVPLTEYYGLLGVVFQDFSLFSFSIKENISMNTAANEDKLSESIRKTGLEARIKTLPSGVDTYIYKEFDPDGIELSGGEGQKIAIARAIYRSAPIVVFDEPTSALDPIAEYDIYRNFHDLAEKRTAIYISHRLSSTRFTDHIAVFSGGTIAEYGTHEELMRIDGGVYKELFEMQAQYYQE